MTADKHRFDIYSITKTPFGGTPDKPYLNAGRRELLKRLDGFLEHRGFAVLTGPVGGGKSSLLNHFRSKLNAKTHQVTYMPFSILSEGDFLRAICMAMDIESASRKSKMINAIQSVARDIQPVNPVLILDEAQKISPTTLEFVRFLANFDFDGRNLFSVIMAGSNEFLHGLKLRILEPLRQRITFFGKIKPLDRGETEEYVKHGFEVVGACQEVVDEGALTLIHDISGGIPRVINSITRAALENAAEEQSPLVKLEHVRKAQEYTFISERETSYD